MSNILPPEYTSQSAGSMQPMADPYKTAVERRQNEVYLRSQIAEQTTTWIRRYGGPRVLTALREWLDYMDRQVEIMQQYNGSGLEAGRDV